MAFNGNIYIYIYICDKIEHSVKSFRSECEYVYYVWMGERMRNKNDSNEAKHVSNAIRNQQSRRW